MVWKLYMWDGGMFQHLFSVTYSFFRSNVCDIFKNVKKLTRSKNNLLGLFYFTLANLFKGGPQYKPILFNFEFFFLRGAIT